LNPHIIRKMEWEASDVPGEQADMVISKISNCNGKLICKRPADLKSSKLCKGSVLGSRCTKPTVHFPVAQGVAQ
jgi:hypothetical protein